MKKYTYLLFEAAGSIVLVLFMAAFAYDGIIRMNTILYILSFLVAFPYFFQKILLGLKLLLDIFRSPTEATTSFVGNAGEEHLDFFYKIRVSNIYFDEPLPDKKFVLFDDACDETLRQGDKVNVIYYKYSRVVLSLSKVEN